jgi:hypothetical protein
MNVLCWGEYVDIHIARRWDASVCDEKIEPENSCILAHAFSLTGTVKPWEEWKHEYDEFVLQRSSVFGNMSMPDSAKLREKLQNFDFLLSESQIVPQCNISWHPGLYLFPDRRKFLVDTSMRWMM